MTPGVPDPTERPKRDSAAVPAMHWCARIAVKAGFAKAAEVAVPPGTAVPDAWDMVAGAIGITEDELAALIVQHARVPAVQWQNADPTALRFIPEPVARRHGVFPLREDERSIYIATSDPNDHDAEQDIAFASGRKPVLQLATPSSIATAIDAGYSPMGHAERIVSAAGRDTDLTVRVVAAGGPENIHLDEADAAPIISLANLILRDALAQRASDIHVEPGAASSAVRFRVDGMMREYLRQPLSVHNRVVSRLKVIGQLDIADRYRPQDGRCRVQIADKQVDLRISTVPTRDSEKMVIRILDAANTKRLSELELPEPELRRLQRLITRRDGIVVVTGPTGSGKTTTLYSVLGEVARTDVNVTTIEDPVEYELAGVTQIQADARRQVTFASALRSVLRQDPDVIFVGEIRDAETAEVASHAALTGHLVLTTLHTNDAIGVFARLTDLGLDARTISACTRGVVAQRLMRRLCPSCAAPWTPPFTAEEAQRERTFGVTPARRAVGCDDCGGTGYHGRFAVQEVFEVSEAIAKLIGDGATHAVLLARARAEGMRLMREVAIERLKAGETSLEEIERVFGLPDVDQSPTAEAAKPVLPRVLVTDDDPVVRALLKNLLEKEQFDVTMAVDGESALAQLGSDSRFDLLILDLGLPGMDGRSVLRAARELFDHTRLSIIVLTGSEDVGDEIAVMAEGADDYIRKPLESARFIVRCRAAIRRLTLSAT